MTRLLDVVHVMGRMAPGGTEHQLAGLLPVAHGRFWHATLCVLSSGWDLTRELAASGVPVVELDGAHPADPARVLRFRSLARDADVVHGSLWGGGAFARIATKGLSRPALVMSERAVEYERPRRRRWIDIGLRAGTDAYIGNSPAVVEFIQRWHGLSATDPRIVEIRNGLNSSVFTPFGEADRPSTHRWRIVVVGRLIPGKRVDFLIDLLPRLRETIDAELVVVGDGPDRERLTEISHRLPVVFRGTVASRSDLAAIFRGADVTAMPSRSEGLPNAVLESLACGTPVVASDIAGIRPLAGTGVILVGPDPGEWVQALIDAYGNGRLGASEVGERVRSFNEVAKDHLIAFESAVARRSTLAR